MILQASRNVQAGDFDGSIAFARMRETSVTLSLRSIGARLSLAPLDIHLGGRPRRFLPPTRSRAAIACSM